MDVGTGQAYQPGDVIFRCEPWVFSVVTERAKKACHRCLKTPLEHPAIRCKGCSFARYCSAACQAADDEHGKLCPVEAMLIQTDARVCSDVRMVIKMLHKLMVSFKFSTVQTARIYMAVLTLQLGEYSEAAPTEKPSAMQLRTYFSLLSHRTEILLDFSRLAEIREVYERHETVLQPLLMSAKTHLANGHRSGISPIEQAGSSFSFSCSYQRPDCSNTKENISPVHVDNSFGKSRNQPPDFDLLTEFDFFVELMGKLQCNAFGILDDYLEKVGEGLYLSASVLDHACGFERNAHYSFQGTTLTVKATQAISCVCQARISYVDCFVPKACRRQKLADRYFFECMCLVCVDPQVESGLFAVKCEGLDCQKPVFLRSGNMESTHATVPTATILKCDGCGRPPTHQLSYYGDLIEEHLLEHEEMEILTEEGYSDDETSNAAQLTRCMEMAKTEDNILHPTNFLLGLTFERLGRLYMNLSEKQLSRTPDAPPWLGSHLPGNQHTSKGMVSRLSLATAFSERALPALRTFYGRHDPAVGIFLLTLGQTQLQNGFLRAARETLGEANSILELVDDRDASLCSLIRGLLASTNE